MRFSLFAYLFTLVAVAGCHSENTDPAGANTDSLNGTLAVDEQSAGRKHAVAIMNNAGEILCTGVLLSPKVVITAAHCVYPYVNATGEVRSVSGLSVGEGLMPALSTGSRRPKVVKAVVHSGYRLLAPAVLEKSHLNKPSFDVALLSLDKKSGSQSAPKVSEQQNFAGVNLHVTGYGHTEEGSAHRGALSTIAMNLYAHAREAAGFVLVGIQEDGKFNPDSGVCKGDSGAPAFLPVTNGSGETEYRLLGIASFHWVDRIRDACGFGTGFFTRVADVGDWVKSFYAASADFTSDEAVAIPSGGTSVSSPQDLKRLTQIAGVPQVIRVRPQTAKTNEGPVNSDAKDTTETKD